MIDLTKSLGQAPESRSTESARTGRVEVAPFSPSPAMNPRRSMATLPNAVEEEEYNAPAMEVTVAASAIPPALRTLTPKPENDDRWMPPTRATIVETASGGGNVSVPRRGKSRFRIVAILWPVIAVGGILGWHFRGESRGKAELRKQLTVLTCNWPNSSTTRWHGLLPICCPLPDWVMVNVIFSCRSSTPDPTFEQEDIGKGFVMGIG